MKISRSPTTACFKAISRKWRKLDKNNRAENGITRKPEMIDWTIELDYWLKERK